MSPFFQGCADKNSVKTFVWRLHANREVSERATDSESDSLVMETSVGLPVRGNTTKEAESNGSNGRFREPTEAYPHTP